MYEVILDFPERYDDDHQYHKGDAYPRKEFTPTKERIQELLTGANRAGMIFIAEKEPIKPKKDTAEAEK